LRDVLGEAAEYVDRDELDITDEIAVKDWFASHEYDFVINCAAYTAVDKAEDEPGLAMLLNATAAGWLAKYGRRIIHISTDYVFAGYGNTPLKETDPTGPKSVYGKTKLAGEKAVFDLADTCVVIRTAWMVSEYGNNFAKTMRRLGTEKSEIGVVSDQVGSPTYARDLAEAIKAMLPQIKTGSHEIYNFANDGVASSWYDFAVKIMELSGLSCKVNPIATKDFPSRASRPAYSVLDISKIKQTFRLAIRPLEFALEDCIRRM
jgi:dTDP-4-dehydrorhamnose reductase